MILERIYAIIWFFVEGINKSTFHIACGFLISYMFQFIHISLSFWTGKIWGFLRIFWKDFDFPGVTWELQQAFSIFLRISWINWELTGLRGVLIFILGIFLNEYFFRTKFHNNLRGIFFEIKFSHSVLRETWTCFVLLNHEIINFQ